MADLPPIESFVLVPFGEKAHQVAHVVGHTRTGRVKVRAFNKSRNEWMPGFRTLDAAYLKPAGSQSFGLPKPPPVS